MSILSNVMKKLGYYKAENNELPKDINGEENFISIGGRITEPWV